MICNKINWKAYTSVAPLNIIVNNPHEPWDINSLIQREDYDINAINFDISKLDHRSINIISRKVNRRFVYEHINELNLNSVSMNPNLSFDDIINLIDKRNINWNYLSKTVHIDIIKKTYFKYPWNNDAITENEMFYYKFVMNNGSIFFVDSISKKCNIKVLEECLCIEELHKLIEILVILDPSGLDYKLNLSRFGNVMSSISTKIKMLSRDHIAANPNLTSNFIRMYEEFCSLCSSFSGCINSEKYMHIRGVYREDIARIIDIAYGLNYEIISLTCTPQLIIDLPHYPWNIKTIASRFQSNPEIDNILINHTDKLNEKTLARILPYNENLRYDVNASNRILESVKQYRLYDLLICDYFSYMPEAMFGLPCMFELYTQATIHPHFYKISRKYLESTLSEHDIKMYHMNYNVDYLSNNPNVTLRTLQLLEIGRWEHLHRDVSPYKIHVKAYNDIDIILH
ncbi:hypothetical protein D3C87_1043300 [compost metagenome]